MGFIPDRYSASVRIGARWRSGQLTTLDDRPLPRIRDGAYIELVIPAWAVDNVADLHKLRAKRRVEMLPAKEVVWLGLSKKAVPPELHDKFRVAESGVAASYLLTEVVPLEPLVISVDGSERTKLNDCRCRVVLLDVEARSLNHALTLLSQAFEIDRMSHTGNVFQQGFIHQDDRWRCLDDVRLARVIKALQDLSESEAQEGLGDYGTPK